MRVLIAGIDGYLGWPLALTLAARGHQVGGIDSGDRRQWVRDGGSDSAIPIESMSERMNEFATTIRGNLFYRHGDLVVPAVARRAIEEFYPEAIVHLAEMPSAPWSMASQENCLTTHTNNVLGTLNVLYAMKELCPAAHLVKLGTMGEYGTPDVDIPEGFFRPEWRGRVATLPFPRQAGSWYHQTKVHDSNNIMMACRIWGIRSTDIMQGVVYGTQIPEMKGNPKLATRFDFDQCFGTAINRFCAQAVIGEPLTPYGAGKQRRGFLALRDSMQCLSLVIEKPAVEGEYRVFNQFESVYGVKELALKVQEAAESMGMKTLVGRMENPRIEAEDHYYNPDHQGLRDLGFKPTTPMEDELLIMLRDLQNHKERIAKHREAVIPDIRWDGTTRKSEQL